MAPLLYAFSIFEKFEDQKKNKHLFLNAPGNFHVSTWYGKWELVYHFAVNRKKSTQVNKSYNHCLS
jgi:hypothetical protein